MDNNLYNHSDPANWKWGVFYYNKLDPRLLPPKKNAALGWTINFANKKAWLVLALTFLIPFTISLCVVLFSH